MSKDKETSLESVLEGLEYHGPQPEMEATFAAAFGRLQEIGGQGQLKEVCQSLLTQRVNDAPKYNNLGNWCYELGLLEEAARLYTRALEIDPGNPTIHNNLGNAYYQQNDPTAAQREYQRAIELDAGLAIAHFNLSKAYESQEMEWMASEAQKRALALDPDVAHRAFTAGVQLDRPKVPIIKKILGKCHETGSLVLRGGRQLRTMFDLIAALAEMDDGCFRYHAAQPGNDFSRWLEDVWEESDLAQEVRAANSAAEAGLTIGYEVITQMYRSWRLS